MDFELVIIDPITQEERVATPDDDLQPGQQMILRAVNSEQIEEGGRYWKMAPVPTLDMSSAN